MQFHQKIGSIFASFTALCVGANLFLVSNPDRFGNILELSILTALFAASCFTGKKLAAYVHSVPLVVVSFIAMTMPDPLSNVFAGLVAIFCLILIHAYGGFRTHPFWKLPATFFAVFGLCLIASSHLLAPESEQWVRAFAWAVGMMAFLFLVWLAFEEDKSEIRRLEADVIKHNRALLEENKRLTARFEDDAN